MKKRNFVFIILALFFITCKSDIEAPTINNKNINVEAGDTAIKFTWNNATDLITSQEKLVYKVVLCDSDKKSIAELEELKSILMDWTVNTNNLEIKQNDLKASNNWIFVLVKDEAGNIAVYKPIEIERNKELIVGNLGKIESSDLKYDEVKISWTLATAIGIDESKVEYRLLMSDDSISSLEETYTLPIEAVVFDWTKTASKLFEVSNKNLASYTIKDLNAESNYNFNVIVRVKDVQDDEDRIFLYNNLEVTTKKYINKPPRPGGNGELFDSNIEFDEVRLSWHLATDLDNDEEILEYKILKSAESINDLETAQALEEEAVVLDWTLAKSGALFINEEDSIANFIVTGLEQLTDYNFNVLVRDLEDEVLYNNLTVTTAKYINKNPVPGNDGELSYSELRADSVKISWELATDLETDFKDLKYKILQSSSSINDIASANTSLTLVDWSKPESGNLIIDRNTASYIVTGLNEDTEYNFNILVEDEDEGQALYKNLALRSLEIISIDPCMDATDVSGKELTLNWNLAESGKNNSFEYKVVFSKNSKAKSIAEIDAASGEDVLVDWTEQDELVFSDTCASLEVGNLEYVTDYYFQVLVKDSEDNMKLYDQLKVKTSETNNILPNPGNHGWLQVEDKDYNYIKFSWELATDPDMDNSLLEYKVLQSASPINDLAIANALPVESVLVDWAKADNVQFVKSGNKRIFTVSNLETDTWYNFNIVVRDDEGEVLYRNLNVKTDECPPEAGNKGQIEYSELSTDSVKITWTLATDRDSDDALLEYKIVQSVSPISDIATAKSLPALVDWTLAGSGIFSINEKKASYTISGLDLNTSYNFNILVKDNDDGYGLYNNLEITTLKIFNIEDINLKARNIGNDSFTLAWNQAVSGIGQELDYKVVSSDNPDINSIEQIDELEYDYEGVLVYWDEQDEITFSGNEASIIVTGLNYDTTYYYNVMVRDEEHNKKIYKQLQVQTRDVIDNVAPIPGENGDLVLSRFEKTLVEITWAEASDNFTWTEDLEYKAVFSSSPILTIATAQSAIIIQDWSKNIFKASASSLYVDETYYFNVLVRDRAGNIALYNQLKVTTPTQYEFVQWDVDTFTSSLSSGYTSHLGPKLAFKDDSGTTMVITYMTDKVNDDATLRFGDNPSNLKYEFPSLKKGEVHHLEIYNLEPNREYYYSLSLNTESFVDAERNKYRANTVLSFKTMSNSEVGQSVLLIGDQQPKNDGTQQMNNVVARALRERIDQDDVRMVVQVGDVCEMNAIAPTSTTGEWTRTLSSLTMFASKVPQMSVIGNHDRQSPYQYKTVFPYSYAPGITISDDDAYYSLDFGKAHFIFLDSKGKMAGYDGIIEDKQLTWFKNDIEDAIARGQEWIFVSFHLSMLCNGADPDMGMKIGSGGKGRAYLQEAIIPIAAKYKVDGIFWGHDHLYEHWQYDYGQNGYFYQDDNERIVAETPLMLFEIGGGGAVSELSWNVFKNNQNETKTWYNTATGKTGNVPASQNSWNKNKYFDVTDSYFGDTFSWIKNWSETGYGEKRFYYGFPFEVDSNNNVVYENGKKKYSSDSGVNYSTDNEWYGYQYGETAPHYMEIHFNHDGSATLTTRYPNHKIMGDRPGVLPPEAKQEFVIYKKNR